MGAGWRRELTPFLEYLGFNVIDPVIKESNIQVNQREQDWYNCKRSKKRYHIFTKHMRKIIDLDLDIVENYATHLVIFWDKYAGLGAGSQGEITLGYKLWRERKTPELYLIADGMHIHEVPAWILGCCQQTFTSIGGFKRFMRNKYVKKRKTRKKSEKKVRKKVGKKRTRKIHSAKVIPLRRAKSKRRGRKIRKKI